MSQLVYSDHTGSHPVLVTDEGPLRCLRFGTGERQSCVDLRTPWVLQLAYTRWMMSALLLPQTLQRLLLLGLGGGGMVHFLHRHLPHVRLDVVERERLIIDLARRYFLLPAADTLHLFRQDAVAFLETPDACGYQVALVDIFTPGAMAAPVFEPAFHRALLDRLDADGVLAVNLWSGDRPSFDRALAALEEASGGQLLQMQVSRRSNVIVLAFPVAIPRAAIKRARKNGPFHQRRYQLDFPRYLKRLRRGNRLPLLARLLG